MLRKMLNALWSRRRPMPQQGFIFGPDEPTPPAEGQLSLESGDALLLENGDKLLLEGN